MTDQSTFRAALSDPGMPVPPTLTDGTGRPAGRRFAVYRNNVAVSLTEALIDGFPACYMVLGDDQFRGMAAVYLRAHPPESPLMARFGMALPAFLDAAPQVARMRWIGDLARLELALRDSYHAADADALTPAMLSAIPPEDLGDTRFALAQSLRLIRSDWPVWSIWQRTRDTEAPQATPGAQDVVILRPGYDPAPHLLSTGDAEFIDALAQGSPLSTAAEAACAVAPDHDPTAILTLLMQSNALIQAPGGPR
ncbi:DNA-binding domain-containing protein [Pseudooceanicola onchidii]|uniref:HvfC/BufC N-terminal domain-containing protein n=1 Tax=Pseudooceanicola onchidii TaxID=2562279 RepID=UPI0010AB2920|nr:DNA-binding domain-containing protein [Pseudooceanicola onchidii]